MLKTKHTVALLFPVIVFFLAFSPLSSAQEPEAPDYEKFDNLSIAEGLSQISVLSIFEDSKGYIWFGTRYGLNRYDGYTFDHFVHNFDDSLSLSDNYIKNIAEDLNGNIWVGTMNGLNKFDPVSQIFERFYFGSSNQLGYKNTVSALGINDGNDDVFWGGFSGLWKYIQSENKIVKCPGINDKVYCLSIIDNIVYAGTTAGLAVFDDSINQSSYYYPFEGISDVKMIHNDRMGNLWIAGRSDIAIFDKETRKIKELINICSDTNPAHNDIRGIADDSYGRIIVTTTNGVRVYDPKSKTVKDIKSSPSSGFLPNDSFESIFIDSAENLWLGTYSHGAYIHNPYRNRFNHYNPETLDKSIGPIGPIGPIAINGNKVYFGTEIGGLLSMDTESEEIESFLCRKDTEAYNENNIKSLLVAGNTLYASVYAGWLYTYDLSKNRFTERHATPLMQPIYSICRDHNDNIILGTYSVGGVQVYDLNKKTIKAHPLFSSKEMRNTISQVTSMIVDGDSFYIGTKTNGLFFKDSSSFSHYSVDSIGRMISSIVKDSRNNILIGTLDAGLNIINQSSKKITKISRKDGLIDNKVCSIVEDKSGNIWISTQSGISKLSSHYSVERTYSNAHGMNIYEFSNNSACIAENNDIYFGGSNGFVVFNPSKLNDNTFIPPVRIKNIIVNNTRMPFDPDKDKTLTLNNYENDITIEYNSLNYIFPEQNQYLCKLEGIDENWVDVGTSHTIRYSNLKPGKYRFLLKGSNNDGYWNNSIVSISFLIKYPIYLRWWAVFFYLIIVAVISYFLISHRISMRLLNQQILKKKQDEDIYNAKIELFTSFSHEIKNPLTLIQGPIEEVIDSNDPSLMNISSFRMVYNNIKRLLLLVNQLMTFRKNDVGALELKVSKGNVLGFATEMKIAFEELAKAHNVDLKIENHKISDDIWYDRSLLESVFMNILTNAFKYVPDGGSVKISLCMISKNTLLSIHPQPSPALYLNSKDYLRIIFEDNGPGLNPDDLEKIFHPFFQSSQSKFGTGLGLSLAKGIIDSHHGDIWAENIKIGGARFNVILPTGSDHFSEKEIIKEYKDSEDVIRYKIEDEIDSVYVMPEAEEEADAGKNRSNKKKVLVVDDNVELRKYVASKLKKYYNVLEASNGKEGLLIASSEMPSIILSDIMMPEVDGLQMCAQLKNNSETSHIPIILLTARSLVQQVNEGLKTGADDYITKPFSINNLLAKIHNILESRENLKNLYAKGLSLENMGVELASSDDKFLQKLNTVVIENISNPEFDIEIFCDKLCMSRASLYRKIESTTGMSPSKYILTIRLTIAAKLLRETDKLVVEILDIVGLSNPMHFSTIFKKKFGETPSQYRKSHKESENN